MIRAEDTVDVAMGHTHGWGRPFELTYWSRRSPSVPTTGIPARSMSPESMVTDSPSDDGPTGMAKIPSLRKLRMYGAPSWASQPSSTYWMSSWRPQIPPVRLTWLRTASMAKRTSRRNDAPIPESTTVVAILMESPLTPWSVAP